MPEVQASTYKYIRDREFTDGTRLLDEEFKVFLDKKLCDKVLWTHDGKMKEIGEPAMVLNIM